MKGGYRRLRAGAALPLTKSGRLSRQIQKMLRLNGWVRADDYYPAIYYKKIKAKNAFCIKLRLDGSYCSERLRNCGQVLADMFKLFA